MFCSKCGTQIPSGSNICPNCGNFESDLNEQQLNTIPNTMTNMNMNQGVNQQIRNTKIMNNNIKNNIIPFVGMGVAILFSIILLVIFVVLPLFKKEYYSVNEIVCKRTLADKMEDGRTIIVASFENNELKVATKHTLIKYSSANSAKSFYDIATDDTFGVQENFGCSINDKDVTCVNFYNANSDNKEAVALELGIDSTTITKDVFVNTYKSKGYKCGRK